VHAGDEVSVEVDNNGTLIAGDPCWILGQQLRARPIHILNTIVISY